MFYYYFKSKQDIYLAVVDQFLTQRLERKCSILEDETIPFSEKQSVYRSLLQDDIKDFADKFHPQDDKSITDASYKLWNLVQMLNRMSKSHAKYILQGVKEGALSKDLGITEENAEAYAVYSLYGAWGMAHNAEFTDNGTVFSVKDVVEITDKLFH